MAAGILITNIGKLVGIETKGLLFKAGAGMSELTSIDNAYLWIEDGKIKAFGQALIIILVSNSSFLPIFLNRIPTAIILPATIVRGNRQKGWWHTQFSQKAA